jgi:hypothetical protein
MGRQTGLIKVSGNIGGVSFYKSNGEDLARVANGPSKEKIQTSENFVRTRENNSEFGGAATTAKALRLALATSIQTMADNRMVSRLTALMKDIISRSAGIRGQRPARISANRTLLINYEFNNKVSFGSIFNMPYTLTPSVDRNSSILTVADFLPQNFIKAPQGATHFSLISAIGLVSDYIYQTDTGKYEAVDPGLNLQGAIAVSGIIAVKSNAPINFSLRAAFATELDLTPNSNVVQCLGIQFYQKIDGIDYILAQNNAMKIIAVF